MPQPTVEENIFLGAGHQRSLLDKRELHRRAVDILGKLGFPIKARTRGLSVARRTADGRNRRLRPPPAILIFDEPTVSLTERETDRLLRSSTRPEASRRHLHHPPDGRDPPIGDRITVLRDGRKIATLTPRRQGRPAHRADDRPGHHADFSQVNYRPVWNCSKSVSVGQGQSGAECLDHVRPARSSGSLTCRLGEEPDRARLLRLETISAGTILCGRGCDGKPVAKC